MKKIMDKYQFQSWISFLLLAVSIVFVFKAITEIDVIFGWFNSFFMIINPFLWGFVLAYILSIPCGKMENLLKKSKNKLVNKHNKGISILIAYSMFFFVIYLAMSVVLPAVFASVNDFVINFNNVYIRNIEAFINEIDSSEFLAFIDLDAILASILNSISFTEILKSFSLNNLVNTLNAILSVSSYVLNAALALITSVYCLLEEENFRKFSSRVLKAFTSRNVYNIFMKYLGNINNYFKQFIYCQVIDAAILGTIVTIELSVLGAKYALALGPIIGVMNLIPYFGAIVGAIIAIIVIAFTDNLTMAVVAAILLVITQQIDGNFLQPKLLGGSLAISPLLIIISITIGGAFFGVPGMVCAIPVVTVCKNILEDILSYIEKRKKLRNESV